MYGGRWNEPGTQAIYTAGSRSLAALEVLVHYSVLPRDFVVTPIRIPDGIDVIEISPAGLPNGWQTMTGYAGTQALGTLELGHAPVLRVPSAVIPQESNFVLNPA